MQRQQIYIELYAKEVILENLRFLLNSKKKLLMEKICEKLNICYQDDMRLTQDYSPYDIGTTRVTMFVPILHNDTQRGMELIFELDPKGDKLKYCVDVCELRDRLTPATFHYVQNLQNATLVENLIDYLQELTQISQKYVEVDYIYRNLQKQLNQFSAEEEDNTLISNEIYQMCKLRKQTEDKFTNTRYVFAPEALCQEYTLRHRLSDVSLDSPSSAGTSIFLLSTTYLRIIKVGKKHTTCCIIGTREDVSNFFYCTDINYANLTNLDVPHQTYINIDTALLVSTLHKSFAATHVRTKTSTEIRMSKCSSPAANKLFNVNFNIALTSIDVTITPRYKGKTLLQNSNNNTVKDEDGFNSVMKKLKTEMEL